MSRKIEIDKRLGLSVEQTDNITDEIIDVFDKNRSLREMVEFINEHYDSKSVIAGIMLNIILIEVLHDGTRKE